MPSARRFQALFLAAVTLRATAAGASDDWASSLSGPGNDVTRGIARAPAGGVFVAGSFEQRASISGRSLGASSGGADLFIAHLDPAGAATWALGFGSGGQDFIYDLDADASGAVVTGLFSRSVDFGGTSLASVGSGDTFTAKYASDGKLLWVKGAGSAALDGGNEIAIGAQGRVHVIGNTLGDFTAEGTTLPWLGVAGETTQDAFVLDYAADGSLSWVRSVASGSGDDMGRAVSSLPDGDVIVAGSFSLEATIAGTVHRSAGERDVWVARLGADGTPKWSVRWGGAGEDYARGIDPAPDDGIYVSGVFSGSVRLSDSVQLDAIDGGTDVFVAALDGDGGVRWAVALGGTGPDEGCEIESDAEGLWCAGEFAGTMNVAGTSVVSAGARDLFVARLTNAGLVSKWFTGGGIGDDVNYALVAHADAQGVTSVGTFSGEASYGTVVLRSEGMADSYVWSLDARAPGGAGGSAGAAGVGGTTGEAGTADPPANGSMDSGCSCRTRDTGRNGAFGIAWILGLWLAWRTRRRGGRAMR